MMNTKTALRRMGLLAIVGIAGALLLAGLVIEPGSAEDAHEADPHTEDLHPAESHEDEHNHEDDEHGDEEAIGHEKHFNLSAAEMAEFGIELASAGPGTMEIEVQLPGEVRLNADRLAHVVPRLSGVVREVHKNMGDFVRTGEVMAELDSRELATAKAAFLAARERVSLALSSFTREKKLWEDKISAERDYLEAKQALAEARIDMRAAEQQLEAIGMTQETIQGLSGTSPESLTRFPILAPFDGTVIEKHITLGEALEADAEAFLVADLSTVWVDLSVYQKDLLSLREGQEVILSCGAEIPDATGVIAYIGPVVGEQTRMALARIVLPNPEGLWRPGLFVTAGVSVDHLTVPVVIPHTALLTLDDETIVFTQKEEEFEVAHVEVGRTDAHQVEILSGLEPGTRYVARGGFHLKAELGKEAFAGDGHNH